MIHMQIEPPPAPIISSFLLPRRSISKNSQTKVKTVFTTPKMPVVRKAVFPPLMPIDLKTAKGVSTRKRAQCKAVKTYRSANSS